VTVVTAAQIDQFGYRTLADVLRSVPGFYVTDDRNYSYLGVRGFGRPGDYSTRVLLLLDGFRLNDAVYDMAPIGHDFPIDLRLVERVEIVRGPGAAIYGNSALFAVVNVVTKRGRDLGGELSASATAPVAWEARSALGRRLPSGVEFVLSARTAADDGESLRIAELDDEAAVRGLPRELDEERHHQLFGSLSYGKLSLFAAHGSREKGIPTGAYDAILDDPRSRTWDTRTLAALRFETPVTERWAAFGRLHYGRYRYTGHYAYEAPLGGLQLDRSFGEWWGVDWGLQSQPLGRHRLTLGGELQDNRQQEQDWSYEGSADRFEARHRSHRWALYAQDELRVTSSLKLQLGLRHDDGQASGSRTSPRAALVATRGPSTLKLLYGEAFRAPNEYERYYYQAAPSLRPESIRTAEAVLERQLRGARVSAAFFQNRVDGLVTLLSDGDLLVFENSGGIVSRGLEAAADATWRGALRSQLSYSLQRTSERATGALLTNSPRHLVKGRLLAPLVEERLTAGLDVQYVSPRKTIAGGRVPGFVVTNLTLRAPRLLGRMDVAVSAYNLFDARYFDPGSEEHRQDRLPQRGRSVRLALHWRF
jgi:iron complex outermembrane receptor protein